MRLHVLSGADSIVLALEMVSDAAGHDRGAFVAGPGQCCHDVCADADLLNLVRRRDPGARARLRVVVEGGAARLAY